MRGTAFGIALALFLTSISASFAAEEPACANFLLPTASGLQTKFDLLSKEREGTRDRTVIWFKKRTPQRTFTSEELSYIRAREGLFGLSDEEIAGFYAIEVMAALNQVQGQVADFYAAEILKEGSEIEVQALSRVLEVLFPFGKAPLETMQTLLSKTQIDAVLQCHRLVGAEGGDEKMLEILQAAGFSFLRSYEIRKAITESTKRRKFADCCQSFKTSQPCADCRLNVQHRLKNREEEKTRPELVRLRVAGRKSLPPLPASLALYRIRG